jgi:predicted aconitase with swiveling domain
VTVSTTIVLRGRTVCGGRAEGEALVTRQTIPGWGGVNPVQGVITETQHELRGVSFKDKVLVFRGAKGSSGWSAMYHTARLAGTAPKALVFNEMTTRPATGSLSMPTGVSSKWSSEHRSAHALACAYPRRLKPPLYERRSRLSASRRWNVA